MQPARNTPARARGNAPPTPTSLARTGSQQPRPFAIPASAERARYHVSATPLGHPLGEAAPAGTQVSLSFGGGVPRNCVVASPGPIPVIVWFEDGQYRGARIRHYFLDRDLYSDTEVPRVTLQDFQYREDEWPLMTNDGARPDLPPPQPARPSQVRTATAPAAAPAAPPAAPSPPAPAPPAVPAPPGSDEESDDDDEDELDLNAIPDFEVDHVAAGEVHQRFSAVNIPTEFDHVQKVDLVAGMGAIQDFRLKWATISRSPYLAHRAEFDRAFGHACLYFSLHGCRDEEDAYGPEKVFIVDHPAVTLRGRAFEETSQVYRARDFYLAMTGLAPLPGSSLERMSLRQLCRAGARFAYNTVLGVRANPDFHSQMYLKYRETVQGLDGNPQCALDIVDPSSEWVLDGDRQVIRRVRAQAIGDARLATAQGSRVINGQALRDDLGRRSNRRVEAIRF